MKRILLVLISLLTLINTNAQVSALNVGKDSYLEVKQKLSQVGVTFFLADDSFARWQLIGGNYIFDVLIPAKDEIELFFANNTLYAVKVNEELIKIDLPTMKKFKIAWNDAF